MKKHVRMVVLEPELHKRARRAADTEDIFLKALVARAVERECKLIERKEEKKK